MLIYHSRGVYVDIPYKAYILSYLHTNSGIWYNASLCVFLEIHTLLMYVYLKIPHQVSIFSYTLSGMYVDITLVYVCISWIIRYIVYVCILSRHIVYVCISWDTTRSSYTLSGMYVNITHQAYVLSAYELRYIIYNVYVCMYVCVYVDISIRHKLCMYVYVYVRWCTLSGTHTILSCLHTNSGIGYAQFMYVYMHKFMDVCISCQLYNVHECTRHGCLYHLVCIA
jgi:hypothetical protein